MTALNVNSATAAELRRVADLLDDPSLPALYVNPLSLQVPEDYGDEVTRRALVDRVNDLLGVSEPAVVSSNGVYAPSVTGTRAYTAAAMVPAVAS